MRARLVLILVATLAAVLWPGGVEAWFVEAAARDRRAAEELAGRWTWRHAAERIAKKLKETGA